MFMSAEKVLVGLFILLDDQSFIPVTCCLKQKLYSTLQLHHSTHAERVMGCLCCITHVDVSPPHTCAYYTQY